jgi:DNA polymerase-3 subunit alpha (Gram-positive type)
MINNYVAFDLETTGLNVEKDYIIEIGALKVIDGKVTDRFMTFLKPPCSIPYHITQITGIDDSMVANARDTEEIIRSFVDFCNGYILVGHNIMFDYKFVKKYATKYGLSFNQQGIDTLQISKKVHKDMDSRSLGSLCAHYDIENQAAHRAYHDALATAKLYHILAHHFEEKNTDVFQPKELIYVPKKVQPCTKKQLQYLETLCNYHNICMDPHASEFSRSEMSRYIDQIVSTHGFMHS